MTHSSLKPPATLATIPEDWYPAMRYAMSTHLGAPIRAHPSQPSIEVRSEGKQAWLVLLLPGDVHLFESNEQRDLVLAKLFTI